MSSSTRPVYLAATLSSVIALTACSPSDDRDSHEPSAQDWPTGLVSPIEGATFSLDTAHFPRTAGERDNGIDTGFIFINGASGRPLADDEAVRAVADGEIIRIDRNYEPPEPNILKFWRQNAAEPGPIADYALDKLRGRQVWIRHEHGHVSRYAHLSEVHPELQPGDPVEQAQAVGLMGNSGIIASKDQWNAAPRLQFELWSADGDHYLGQGLTALESHRTIASLFADEALPRHARSVVVQVESGQAGPTEYPPPSLESSGFHADVPENIVAGSVFSIPITWEASEFEPDDLFAGIDNQPLGILEVDGGALAIGALPIENFNEDATVTLGGIDKFGQTLTGSRTVQVASPEVTTQPLEIDSTILELYTSENLKQEEERLWRATARSLQQLTPRWTQPFQAPLEGDVYGLFGQRLFYGVLRPQHPLPGLLVFPTEETTVTASNDGAVALVAELPIRGKTVVIAHGGGVISIYARLDEIHVSEGDSIQRGEPLGVTSDDGTLQEKILLWEIHVAGVPTNPQDWLDRLFPET